MLSLEPYSPILEAAESVSEAAESVSEAAESAAEGPVGLNRAEAEPVSVSVLMSVDHVDKMIKF